MFTTFLRSKFNLDKLTNEKTGNSSGIFPFKNFDLSLCTSKVKAWALLTKSYTLSKFRNSGLVF